MNKSVIMKHSIALFALLCSTTVLVAQNRSKETFKVGNDALVSVNTSYSNVIIETWSKDEIEVEAFVDGESLTEKEKSEIFKNWDINVMGNSKKVDIKSDAGGNWSEYESYSQMNALKSLESLKSLEGLAELESLKEMQNFNFHFDAPDVPDVVDFPQWPFGDQQPNVSSINGDHNYQMGSNSNNFDSSEYEKNKQKYVNKLNKKYNKNVSVKQVDKWLEDVEEWSEDFSKVMEEWGKNFSYEFENKFGPEFELKMEKWGEEFGEKFGKEMEKWGEEFGKDMEKWGEEFGKDVEEWAKQFEESNDDNSKVIVTPNGSKSKIHDRAKKTIIIRMPKGTRTDINVRHGELKMADAYNINATLDYTSFVANSIDGGKSLINASFAPVSVNNWVEGVLILNYVEDCKLNTVNNINLKANSSDVNINTITTDALLSGSFGNLNIYKVSNTFRTIDIILENADVNIKIPDIAFSFNFNGKKSTFSGPKTLNINKSLKDGRVLLDGFYKTKSSTKALTINANYSNVSLH